MSAQRGDKPYPQAGLSDRGEALVRSLPSVAPVLGPLADALLRGVATHLERRQVQWLNELAERVHQLEGEHQAFMVGDLAENEAWVDALVQATRIAAVTHQAAKIEALQNAVLNVAIRVDADSDLDVVFLNLIERLGPSHLQLLRVLQNPSAFADANDTSVPLTFPPSMQATVQRLLPDIDSDHYYLLRQDLESHGLIVNGAMAVLEERYPPAARLATRLGERFIEFVSSPSG